VKILLISTYDNHGGAARSAFRLCEGLRAAGHDAKMLVMVKEGDADCIIQPDHFSYHYPFNKFRGYFDLLKPVMIARKKILFSSAKLPGKEVIKAIQKTDPDVVHLHWITKGFMQLHSLQEIKRPVIWTLHDMWAMTGGCHSPLECTRYKKACGACPVLQSTKENDLSRRNFRQKKEIYNTLKNLTFISPSRWLADCARKSPLLGSFPVEVIPNSLDTRLFFPEDKHASRSHFGLDHDRKIILFGALNALTDTLKGFAKLRDALKFLSDKNNTELIVFGADHSKISSLSGITIRFLNYIANDNELRLLYSAADVMVVPSMQEAFGQTASEAMACGTPVVAFGITGLLDIIEHHINGYLAKPFIADDLAAGISWCLDNKERNCQLSTAALKTVQHKFDMQKNVDNVISIYKQSLMAKH